MKWDILRDEIKLNHMSISEFAEKIELSESALRRKLKGEKEFKLSEAKRIIVSLRMSKKKVREIFFVDDVRKT